MKRRLGSVSTFKGSIPHGTPGGEGQARLIAWANAHYSREKVRLRARLAIARPDRIEEIDAHRFVDGLGQEGMIQAAAVLARTAAPGELVAAFLSAHISGRTPLGELGDGGAGHSALLIARSADGERFTHAWHSRPHGKGATQIGSWAMDDADASLPDWTGPDFDVDPVLDDALARKGFPGAARARQTAAIFRPLDAPPKAAPALAHVPLETIAFEPRLPAEGERAREPDLPWSAARKHLPELRALLPFPVGATPFAIARSAQPPDFERRSLEDLLEHGWTTEGQAVQLVRKIRIEPNHRDALDLFLASRVPLRAKLFACATAARTLAGHDPAIYEWAARELVARVDADVLSAGGVRKWLDREWPEHAKATHEIGIVGVSCAANAAFWRIGFGLDATEVPLPPDSAAALALARAAELCDALLDRAGAPSGARGHRVAALARSVVRATKSELGEPRLERWQETIRARRDQSPPRMMRDYGAFHAASLYTVLAASELAVARAEAFEDGDLGRYRPEEIDVAGLVGHGVAIVARHMVWKAASLSARGDDAALGLLEKAHALAPWDVTALGCFNEERFKRGRRDARLFEDLTREMRERPSLGAAAEALACAEALNRPRAARVLHRKLDELAEKTPHRWITAVRALFARPGELAKLDRVEPLLAEAPTDTAITPEWKNERESLALYGRDPASAISEARRALSAQREALAWAALVAEVGEDPTEPRRGRPAVPSERDAGALRGALLALRARLDAPELTRALAAGATRARASDALQSIEAHAARAGALTALDDLEIAHADQWLQALSDPACGLVTLLDEALDAPDPTVPERVLAALAHAESALGEAIIASWLGGLHRRVRSLWPTIAQAGAAQGELARRASDIEHAAGHAGNDPARAEVDAALTALLADASAATLQTESSPAEQDPSDGDTQDDADDSFAPMRLGDGALELSRRDLGTPEWALQEGLRQIAFYNLARGRRDLKMLQGTREEAGALWELRHRDERHPVRILYRLGVEGPHVIAVFAKEDERQQRRVIERVKAWKLLV